MKSLPGGTVSAAPRLRRTIDAPVRAFHWLFALCFAGAWATTESERLVVVHATLGLTLAGLLAFRLAYGLAGPRQARLASLWRKRPSGPVSAAMLALTVPLVLTGYATYQEWGGRWGAKWLEELHEGAANLFLAVVLGHLAMLAGLSLLRRRNLARPMLTGHMEGIGPDLAKRNHAWLAILLIAAVAGYWIVGPRP